MFSRSKSVDVARGRGVSLYPFQCLRANFIKGVYLMTRSFFSKVLSVGGAVTRKYFYLVETFGDVVRIVRYPRRQDGSVWLPASSATAEKAGYVCAVYPR